MPSFTPPIPKSPLIDSKTGLISRDWYIFLLNLFNSVGAGAGGTTTQVLHGGGAGYGQINLAADVTNVLPGVNGGTGISNALKTITLGGNLLLGGAFTTTPTNSVTIATVGATSVTLPTSGTLITGVNLSGDVFATGTNTGTAVATITSKAVSNSKLSNMPPNTIKANNTGTTGAPVDATIAQIFTLLGGFSKVGTFTRDTSAATGTQAITGVGFTPTSVLFIGAISATTESSWGADNSSTFASVYGDGAVVASGFGATTGASLFFQGALGSYNGNIQSLDSDGFTITWTKSGTHSGTATIAYIAFR